MSKPQRAMLTSFFISLAMLSTSSVLAMGEKYTEQGHALGGRVFEFFVERGYCQNVSECNQRRFLFGEDGDKVHLNFYGITDKKIIASVMEYVVREGLFITGGVPITIQFFTKPKEELLGFKSFTAEPAIKMELNN